MMTEETGEESVIEIGIETEEIGMEIGDQVADGKIEMIEETGIEGEMSVEEMIEGDPEGLAGMMIEETEEILGGEEMKIGGTEMEEEEMGEGMTEKWMMLEVDCRVWLKGGQCPFLICQIYQDQRICPRRKTTEQGVSTFSTFSHSTLDKH